MAAAAPVVLLVDDESRVLSALRRGLRREGFAIETAANAREALARLSEGPVDLVVSDYKMPGTNGIELLTRVRKRWPRTARILLSGWTPEIAESELAAADCFAVLGKPWDDRELREAIRDALRLS